jgi:predicted TIM-barrel fold metal-dependent hydrolase
MPARAPRHGAEAEVARLTGKYDNVYADLAMRLGGPVPVPFDPAAVRRQIRAIGADRVLFGTNYPLVDQVSYVAALRALGLTESELRQVGWENAERLFGLVAS